METLIEKIAINTGIDKEKATEALRTITDHVKEQFPLLHSVVDLILRTKQVPRENQSRYLSGSITIPIPESKVNYN